MEGPASYSGPRSHGGVTVLVSVAALLGVMTVFGLIRDKIVNVVNYRVEPINVLVSWLPFVAPVTGLLAVVFVALWRHSPNLRAAEPGSTLLSALPRPIPAWSAAAPLILTLAVGGLWLAGSPPTFVGFCVAILGLGWAIDRLGTGLGVPGWFRRVDRIAPYALLLAIAAGTIWHTLAQIKFWEHFLLGYADFGFFTTELEHCLPWKEVGAARFSDTRMGYHCVPMFYLLVPFYWLLRSPIFLMVVGPLALNLAAVPFYQLARQRTGSATTALLISFAWLALPSITRLPYSNTYGFQSIYLAVPWLAMMLSLAMRGRWRAAHLCLAGALLCEETVCGVAVGWGVYLMIWGGRRRDGIWIVVLAIVYLMVSTLVVIPHFASSAEYTRLMLFGELTPLGVLGRLLRPRVLLFLLALGVPLLPGLWRSPRLLIAAVPTLFLVLVLQQRDYLNIKYWHQTSILPVLFTAAIMGVTGDLARKPRPAGPATNSLGSALGMLVVVLLFSQWMGSSPISQAQRVYAAEPRLQAPDSRLAAVDYVRAHFPRETTTIIATERMAAHFTDYRMVRPAPEVRLADTTPSAHVLIVDRSDHWDKIVMEKQTGVFLAQARTAGYTPIHTEGPVVILSNTIHPQPDD